MLVIKSNESKSYIAVNTTAEVLRSLKTGQNVTVNGRVIQTVMPGSGDPSEQMPPILTNPEDIRKWTLMMIKALNSSSKDIAAGPAPYQDVTEIINGMTCVGGWSGQGGKGGKAEHLAAGSKDEVL